MSDSGKRKEKRRRDVDETDKNKANGKRSAEEPVSAEGETRRKKRKAKEEVVEARIADTETETRKKRKRKHNDADTEVEPRKKKRKHEEAEQPDAEVETGNKKKKKKQDELAEDPVAADSEVDALPKIKEKKKRKRKHQESEHTGDADEGQGETEKQKSDVGEHKKKRKQMTVADPAPLLPLPSADTLAAFLQSADFNSNEDILRALQNADLSNALQTLVTAGNSLPGTGTNMATAPSKKTPRKRKAVADAKDTQPASDHAELLATKWLSSDQLAELVKDQGLVYKKGIFSPLEAQLASDAVEKYKTSYELLEEDIDKLIFPDKNSNKDPIFWSEIARAVPQRPVSAVYHHLRRARHPLKQQGKWRPEEDDKLIQAVASVGQQWEKISGMVGRLATDCRDRYRNYLKNRDTRESGPWTVAEEEKLSRIVLELQEGKDLDYDVPWTRVAERMGGTRGRQQCRMKWTDSLSLKHKAIGAGVRWSNGDAQMLIRKIAALNVRDDTEIDWKTLPERSWNLWSAHALSRRWSTMKRSVKGFEDMTMSEIIAILEAKHKVSRPAKSAASSNDGDDKAPARVLKPVGK